MPTIDVQEVENEQSKTSTTLEDSENFITSVQERIAQKAQKRHHLYEDILDNKQGQKLAWHVGFYAFGGIVLGTMMNSIIALIPAHDVIKYPQYFYEDILSGIPMSLLGGIYFHLAATYMINVDFLRTIRHCGKVSIGITISSLCLQGLIDLSWVYYGGNRYPMPFRQFLLVFAVIPVSIIWVWIQFPKEWRTDKSFRTRYCYYILMNLNSILITIEYGIFKKTILEQDPNKQWIVVALLPILRELNLWIQSNLAFKAANGKDLSVEVCTSFGVNARHCVFLSTVLGSEVTNLSTWIIVGSDLIINLILTLLIIWMKKKADPNKKEKMESHLVSLVVNEMIEAIVLVTFCICLLLSYYGPNAELICNIGSSHFHCIPIKSIGQFVGNLGFFLGFDVISLISTGLLLWIFARINIFRAYLCLQKEFWVILTLTAAYYTAVVSCSFHNMLKIYIYVVYLMTNSDLRKLSFFYVLVPLLARL